MSTATTPNTRITPEHVDHYREHGYVIIGNVLSPAEIDGARADIDVLRPGWIDYCLDPAIGKPKDWDQPIRSRFPFPGDHLNANTVYPELRRMAAGSFPPASKNARPLDFRSRDTHTGPMRHAPGCLRVIQA